MQLFIHTNRRSMISGILSARHTGSLAFRLQNIFSGNTAEIRLRNDCGQRAYNFVVFPELSNRTRALPQVLRHIKFSLQNPQSISRKLSLVKETQINQLLLNKYVSRETCRIKPIKHSVHQIKRICVTCFLKKEIGSGTIIVPERIQLGKLIFSKYVYFSTPISL